MSKYTTGEMAKLCGVTVRTIQYYDTRNLLVPSELSEVGRRLYSEQDLKRMGSSVFSGMPEYRSVILRDFCPKKIPEVLFRFCLNIKSRVCVKK